MTGYTRVRPGYVRGGQRSGEVAELPLEVVEPPSAHDPGPIVVLVLPRVVVQIIPAESRVQVWSGQCDACSAVKGASSHWRRHASLDQSELVRRRKFDQVIDLGQGMMHHVQYETTTNTTQKSKHRKNI